MHVALIHIRSQVNLKINLKWFFQIIIVCHLFFHTWSLSCQPCCLVPYQLHISFNGWCPTWENTLKLFLLVSCLYFLWLINFLNRPPYKMRFFSTESCHIPGKKSRIIQSLAAATSSNLSQDLPVQCFKPWRNFKGRKTNFKWGRSLRLPRDSDKGQRNTQ